MAKLHAFETTYCSPKQVDHDKGVLYGCKLLGRFSKNGREYTEAALLDAAKLYESLGINLNHHKDKKNDRSLDDLIALRPRNVTVTKEGVYGDVHLVMSDPRSKKLLEVADRDPMLFGFSHEADLRGDKKKGKWVVESVKKVMSLDMVRYPATTNGAFESMADISNITEAEEAQPKDCYALLAEAMSAAQREGNTELATKIHKLLKPTDKSAEEEAEYQEEEAEESASQASGITESEVIQLAKPYGINPNAVKVLAKTLAGKGVKEIVTVFESMQTARPQGTKRVQNSEQTPPSPSSREERIKRYKVS